MGFIPAGEIIGNKHQIRTVTINKNSKLPEGEYSFIDTYCNDFECDCRKTMVHVLLNEKLVSIINYGWESKSFYDNWMGENTDTESIPKMNGASIDITSPNIISENDILELFNMLINDMWISKFKFNYNEVKIAISKR